MTETAQSDNLATRAVRGAANGAPQPHGAVVAPVFHATSYGFQTFDEMRRYAHGERPDAYFYARYANPTVDAAERAIAALEHGEAGVVTASGSAATFVTLATFCAAGDEIIAADAIYGGTLKIMTQLLAQFGITTRFIAPDEAARLPEIVTERTRLFWFESPANPLNRLTNLAAVAEAARASGIISIIDNTFATPILQQPLKHGIDLVVHSATKYLGGHSDVTAGAVVGRKELIDKIRLTALRIGTTLDPAGAYLLTRGLKTLAVRMRAVCDNALRVAEFLQRQPNVTRVYYPGLPDSPDYVLAQHQMPAGCGGIVAFDIAGGETAVARFFDALQMFHNAPSLGGVESLASYPLYSTHFGVKPEQLQAAGISAATVRLAVGIEDAADLCADLAHALQVAAPRSSAVHAVSGSVSES